MKGIEDMGLCKIVVFIGDPLVGIDGNYRAITLFSLW